MFLKVSQLKPSETREVLLEAQEIGKQLVAEVTDVELNAEAVTMIGLAKIIVDLRNEIKEKK